MKTLSNKWLLFFVFIVCILLILPSVVSAAEAQDAGFRALDTIVDTFANSAKSWVYYFRDKALTLFWPLASIALLLMVLPHLFRLDFPALISELVRYLITTGFFYYLILSANPMRPNNLLAVFTQSFTTMAAEATGNIAPETLSPSGIVGTGLSLAMAAIKNISMGDIPGSIVTAISSVIIAIVFVIIAGKMTVLLIELWLKAYISPFVLGFGAWSGTRDIALNYIRSMVALGLKVMTYGLIIGVGKSVVTEACTKAMSPRTITVVADLNTAMNGRGSTKEVITNIITHNDMLVIMSLGLVLLIISETIPGFISGLIGNAGASGSSAISAGSTMAASRMATSAATGGAGAAVAGVSAATDIARQTAAQSQASETNLFKGVPGAGQSGIIKSFAEAKGTAGLGGMASYGASFGLGFAKNAVSGLATMAKMSAARTSAGTFDAAVQLNTARDAKHRNLSAGSSDSKNDGAQTESQAAPSMGKIAGEQAIANASRAKITHEPDPAKMNAIPAVKQGMWDAAESHGAMMQQSLAHITEAKQQATEQMLNQDTPAAPSAASATPGKTGQASPTEPPPLPQDEQQEGQ